LKNNKNWGDRIFDFCNTLIICIVIIATILPFINVLSVSLSSPGAVVTNQVTFYPKGITLRTYRQVLQNPYIFNSYKNSIFYTIVFVIVSVIVTTLAAYPLSKRRLVGRKVILFYITFTTIFHGGMIPTYLVVKSFGLLNSFWSLIIPYCITVYNTMLLRTYFEGLPVELEEAAKIDGMGDFSIMVKIYAPLAMPMYATLILMITVTQWNSFFPPLLYLNDRQKYPLQIILRELVLLDAQESYRESVFELDDLPIEQSIKSAAIMIVSLPMIVIYPFMQRYFVKGMSMGSVKG
jgi:putative aldouronate transport system permease protein